MMIDEFFKFPRTPHLEWLGSGRPRDDKVRSDEERKTFLAEGVVLEEKVDGANLGLSVGPEGRARAQNRGAYLSRRAHPQFEPLWPWLARHEMGLVDALGQDLVLFGEWCYAVHSVRYDRLPDWFLAFDVYDRHQGRFWSTARRDELIEMLGLCRIPLVGHGRFDMADLGRMLAGLRSGVGTGPAEGLYLRRDDGDWLADRAKLVRPEFMRSIEGHWSARPLEKNSLATASAAS